MHGDRLPVRLPGQGLGSWILDPYLDDEAGKDEKDREKRWKEYAAVMTRKDFDDGTSLMVQSGQGAVRHFYGSGEFRRAE